MLNIIWPVFIIISFLYAILFGSIEKLNNSIFESTTNTVNLCLTLIGNICLWNGIMNIANKTTFMKKMTKFFKPIINFLFPEIDKNSKLHEEISMNIIANILGLGNAATPLGIKAMKTMQKENQDKKVLTNTMAMFIVINTASIQFIPTTVIAIRSSLGSNNPTAIVFPVWVATVSAAIAGITATKIFIKISSKGKIKKCK
ncbi:MAG: nucleoside recognition protein [Clostridia bacterium]|nr:nucleoside recognition protein [Clostridia bacterium]